MLCRKEFQDMFSSSGSDCHKNQAGGRRSKLGGELLCRAARASVVWKRRERGARWDWRLCGCCSVLLPFVFVSLEGSSVEVGGLHEEASNEQRVGRSPKKEKDKGELFWNVRFDIFGWKLVWKIESPVFWTARQPIHIINLYWIQYLYRILTVVLAKERFRKQLIIWEILESLK